MSNLVGEYMWLDLQDIACGTFLVKQRSPFLHIKAKPLFFLKHFCYWPVFNVVLMATSISFTLIDGLNEIIQGCIRHQLLIVQ